MTTNDIVAVPRRTIARWREATALLGLGLVTSGVGLAWDYVVHEILREPPESIAALPHLVVFLGIAISGLAFLVALPGLRLRAASAA